MKLKALLLACAVAGALASFALADDGHGKKDKHHTGSTTTTMATTTTVATTTGMTTTAATDCSRVELRGTLASVGTSSFTLTVKRGNDAADSMVGQTVTIAVGPDTRVEWEGTGKLTGPNVGDTAKVKALSCGTPATLTAKRVEAQAPKAARNDEHVNSEHGAQSSKSHK
jgi:hypothetical protein